MGPQVGGREVAVYAEIGPEVATVAALPGSRRRELPAYRAAVARYREQASSPRGIIAEGAAVLHAAVVRDTYIGPFARIDGASGVINST